MQNTTIVRDSLETCSIAQPETACQLTAWQRTHLTARRAWQRGMATAEYAVGILAAVAVALVLLRIATHNEFFLAMLKLVLGLIGQVGGMLP